MRFMILVKADRNSEAGVMPSEQLLAEMGAFNEELTKAGVMLAGEGLHPSAKGARVKFSGNKRSVTDGPFAETKELLAGFWLWQVGSLREAIEWVERCPNPMPGTESEIEIRQVFEADDFGAEFTPELREQEQRQRARIAATQSPGMLSNKDAVANLAVKSLATAGKFYEGTLGLEQIGSEGDELIVYRSGRTTLNVYRSDYAGTNKATAVTWAVGDVEGVARQLAAKGVTFEHYDMPDMKLDGNVHVGGGMKVAWFKDPDGNILNLVNG